MPCNVLKNIGIRSRVHVRVSAACKWKVFNSYGKHNGANTITSKNSLRMHISPISETHIATQKILHLFILCDSIFNQTCRMLGTLV